MARKIKNNFSKIFKNPYWILSGILILSFIYIMYTNFNKEGATPSTTTTAPSTTTTAPSTTAPSTTAPSTTAPSTTPSTTSTIAAPVPSTTPSTTATNAASVAGSTAGSTAATSNTLLTSNQIQAKALVERWEKQKTIDLLANDTLSVAHDQDNITFYKSMM